MEGGAVGCYIHAKRKTRDYDNIRMPLAKICNDALAKDTAFVRRLTSTDNREYLCRLEIHASLAKERNRRVRALGKSARVCLIGISQHAHAIPIRLIHLNLRESEGMLPVARYGLEDSPGIGREITLGGGKDILCGAKIFYELAQSLRTNAIYLTKGEEVLEIVGHLF